jgi:hypothetical protein
MVTSNPSQHSTPAEEEDSAFVTPTLVRVREVVTERQHQPRLGWRLDSSFQIVELRTDFATLEWAVPADRLEWAVMRVQGSDPSAPQP